MVKLGNIYYFLYIIICIGVFLTIYFCFKFKNEKFKKRLVGGMVFGNLGLHFLKLLFPPYINEFPICLRSITFTNICAVSTLLFPLIYSLKGCETLKNYMFFIGVLGGGLALFYPTEAFNKSFYEFDVIRFYICHFNLIAVPLLSALFDIHKPSLKKLWTIPLYFLAHETLILLNEIFIVGVGLVPNHNIHTVLDRNYFRNYSFVFGPPSSFDGISKALTVFVPKILTQDIFGINNGVGFYWPVIWLIIPAFIYLVPVYLIVSYPFALHPYIKNKYNAKKTAEQKKIKK